MLDRRHFLLGACCALRSMAASAQEGTAPYSKTFVCSTVDPPPSASLSETDYAASGDVGVPGFRAAIADLKITDYGAAFFKDRWRPRDGMTPHSRVVTLGIHFMDHDPAKAAEVRRVAPEWLEGEIGQLVAFRFDVPADRAQIRIRFDSQGGNNSFVGRQNLLRRADLHTMNLQDIDPAIILHEFGHALGLQHEHHHPGIRIAWNEPSVISALSQQNWSVSYIRSNVLDRFPQSASCVGDPEFNADSIMIYPIPPDWTLDGFSTRVNTRISERDRRCLLGLYRPD